MKLSSLLFAPFLVLACSSDDAGCPADGECSSAVSGRLTTSISAAEMGAATVQGCVKIKDGATKNCSKGVSGTVPTGADPITFVLDGAIPATAYLTKSGNKFEVQVTFSVESQSPTNGDEFSIELLDPSGASIEVLSRVVTYATVTPNGPGCLPTCASASFAE